MRKSTGFLGEFVVCINNVDYPASLELHKIYRVIPDEDAVTEGDIRVSERPDVNNHIKALEGTGQSRAVFERQYLTGSFYLYHSFSVIVAQSLSFVGITNIIGS
jgi:hypothetical protein